MKMKIMWALLPLMAILAACNQEKKELVNASVSTGDSAVYVNESSRVSCKMRADVPTERLNLAVGEWMDEQFGGTYTGDYRDIQSIVDFYGVAMNDSLCKDTAELGPEISLAYEVKMKLTYETDLFATYSMTTYVDLGGAHPSFVADGASFRKSDGRRIGWEMISHTHSSEFNELMKQHLKEYFEVTDDDELSEMLQEADNLYALPMPQTPPCFDEDGVSFVYQQYEIASYAAGLPSGKFSYDEIKPLMTTWARRLVE